jgi:hypothetical protein
MLFKRRHIELILSGRKTQTRRLPDKSANYHVGRVYGIRDRWFSKPEAHILITRKFRQKLGEISCEDVKKEGTTARKSSVGHGKKSTDKGAGTPSKL